MNVFFKKNDKERQPLMETGKAVSVNRHWSLWYWWYYANDNCMARVLALILNQIFRCRNFSHLKIFNKIKQQKLMACQMFTTGSLLHGNWRRNLILNLWELFPSHFFLFVPGCFSALLTNARSATLGLFLELFIYTLKEVLFNKTFPIPENISRSCSKIILKLTVLLNKFWSAQQKTN